MYAQRDKDGLIVGLFMRPQPGVAEESLADDAPEVVAFRAAQQAALAKPVSLVDQILADEAEVKKLKTALGL